MDATAAARGCDADAPSSIPVRGWREVLGRALRRAYEDRLLTEAAAVAFYALLALAPALAVLVSLYGLVADPATAPERLRAVVGTLPAGGAEVVEEWLGRLAARGGGDLGLRLAAGLGVALWSAGAAASVSGGASCAWSLSRRSSRSAAVPSRCSPSLGWWRCPRPFPPIPAGRLPRCRCCACCAGRCCSCWSESMQNRGGLVSIATPGCGSSIASLTHRTAFGPSSPRLRARYVPERGPAPHDFACSRTRTNTHAAPTDVPRIARTERHAPAYSKARGQLRSSTAPGRGWSEGLDGGSRRRGVAPRGGWAGAGVLKSTQPGVA